MTVELKPCPFCGGEATVDSFKHDSGVAVVCASGCGLDAVGYWSDSHVSIAERWNRRITPDPLSDPRVRALVEAAKEAIGHLTGYGSTSTARINLRDALRAIEEGGE